MNKAYNSELIVRAYSPSDTDAIFSLCDNENENKTISKIINSKFENDKVILACFLENKLVGFSTLIFASCRPWGSLVYLKINTKLKITQRIKILNQLIKSSFECAEEKKCVRVYMVNKLQKRESFLNARLYPVVKKIEILRNYSYITEVVIRAGQKPNFDYEWQLISNEAPLEDIGIVSATRINYEILF